MSSLLITQLLLLFLVVVVLYSLIKLEQYFYMKSVNQLNNSLRNQK